MLQLCSIFEIDVQSMAPSEPGDDPKSQVTGARRRRKHYQHAMTDELAIEHFPEGEWVYIRDTSAPSPGP